MVRFFRGLQKPVLGYTKIILFLETNLKHSVLHLKSALALALTQKCELIPLCTALDLVYGKAVLSPHN